MMHSFSRVVLASLAALTLAAAPSSAQGRGTVSPELLEAAAAARPSPRGEAVRAALSSDRALALARGMGISAEELSARVSQLDATGLEQLARGAHLSDQPLAGGSSTVVISTTTLIIILLILILLTD